jgi:hypothetical protein
MVWKKFVHAFAAATAAPPPPLESDLVSRPRDIPFW